MNDRFLEDLKDRLDIRDVVGKYTNLKKSGKNWMGKSPFRNERTPSFCVNPEKNLWYDFGSSEGGDLISFIEKIENFSFSESVDFLAQIAGVEIPKNFGGDKVSKEAKKDIFTLHKTANEYFVQCLEKEKDVLDYLKNRGITKETITNWGIGFGGNNKTGLFQYLLKTGFSREQIAESGVAFTRDGVKNEMQDRFFGRVLTPVCEPKNGEIIAFSGRILKDKKKFAKYINSPENPVYHKSSTLFGLDKARQNIRDQDFVILVEGNFDVISAHQAGFANVVATCGTSLTDDHLRILKRITKNIYLCFDNDLAGKKATLRSTEMIMKLELQPKIIEITKAKDLDDLLKKDIEKVREIIEKAQNSLDFFLEKFWLKFKNKKLEGEKKFLDAFFYFLRLSERPIEIDDFLGKIATKLNRGKSIIEEEYRRFCKNNKNYQKPKFQKDGKISFTLEENVAGFLQIFWTKFSCEKIIELLTFLQNGNVKNIINKKLEKIDLNEEETADLLKWEMYINNQINENSDPEIQFNDYLKTLKNFNKPSRKTKSKNDVERFYESKKN